MRERREVAFRGRVVDVGKGGSDEELDIFAASPSKMVTDIPLPIGVECFPSPMHAFVFILACVDNPSRGELLHVEPWWYNKEHSRTIETWYTIVKGSINEAIIIQSAFNDMRLPSLEHMQLAIEHLDKMVSRMRRAWEPDEEEGTSLIYVTTDPSGEKIDKAYLLKEAK